jgi:two-component sensor histidine kinase
MPTQLLADFLAETSTVSYPAAALDVHIAESNHRIANNLTLIAGMLRLQAHDIGKAERTLSPDDAQQLLAEVGARIETVGRLHRLLAQGGGSTCLDVADYLQDIAQAAICCMSGRNVALQTPSDQVCELPAQIALSVGFIVGEAVTNAVKYAHPAGAPGVIALDCQRWPDGSTLIRVSDDGVGLPQGFDAITDGGLGFRLMRTIAGQLGAELAFSSPATGLAVSLRLPPNRPVSTD